jgi:hypothetical protein
MLRTAGLRGIGHGFSEGLVSLATNVASGAHGLVSEVAAGASDQWELVGDLTGHKFGQSHQPPVLERYRAISSKLPA